MIELTKEARSEMVRYLKNPTSTEAKNKKEFLKRIKETNLNKEKRIVEIEKKLESLI